MQKRKVCQQFVTVGRYMYVWSHDNPPRLKTLSTAALDAGTLNALRYSLPKVLLLVLYWCQNGKHSSLSGSSISRYFLICWECEKVCWCTSQRALVVLVEVNDLPVAVYAQCKSTGRWSIFNNVSKTSCLEQCVQTKEFDVNKYSSPKYYSSS